MRTWQKWAALAWLGVLVLAGSGVAVDAARTEGESPESLTGRLLVASTEMGDPRFARTVIYMVRHDASGALGLVVNRSLGEAHLKRLLDDFGVDSEGVTGTIPVHAGGPVEPKLAFVLHSSDLIVDGSVVVDERIAVTRRAEILRAIADGKGPRRFLFVLGYAGWAPGQLEGEIAEGAWHNVDYEESLVFEDAEEGKWERAIKRRTIDL